MRAACEANFLAHQDTMVSSFPLDCTQAILDGTHYASYSQRIKNRSNKNGAGRGPLISLSLSLPLSRLAIFGTSSGTEMRLPESTSGEIIN